MIRRFGEPVEAGRIYRHRPGVYAIIRRGSDMLVTHQAAPTPEYQLPGGGIDPGEAPLPALHREAYEETGWRITVVKRLGAFRRFTFMPEYDLWAEKLCHIYLARPALRIGSPSEPGHSPHWVPVAQAPQLLGNAGDRFFAGQLR